MEDRQPDRKICMNCMHFRNDPGYLETEFSGWNALGSAYGSTRKDDGICLENDVYLSSGDWCDRFRPAAGRGGNGAR